MKPLITEIQIIPVKPNNGLLAFCSFILFESLYCSSIAIYTRPDGSYRLVYPTKKLSNKDISLFYPINKEFSDAILEDVIKKFEDVTRYDRYSFDNN